MDNIRSDGETDCLGISNSLICKFADLLGLIVC